MFKVIVSGFVKSIRCRRMSLLL